MPSGVLFERNSAYTLIRFPIAVPIVAHGREIEDQQASFKDHQGDAVLIAAPTDRIPKCLAVHV
jgi:hypothetical protein